MAGLTNLHEQTLNGCVNNTDRGLDNLVDLKSLEYLVIANCPGLTKQRIAALEKSLPDCRIVRD